MLEESWASMSDDDISQTEEHADGEMSVEAVIVLPETPAEEEEEGLPEGPGFMALYTTLMLLLMTFFIVLVSMGSNSSSKEKFEDGKKSIQAAFSVMGLSTNKQVLMFMQSVLRLKSVALQNALELHKDSSTKRKSSKKKDDEEDGLPTQNGEESFTKDRATQLHRFITLGFNVDSLNTNKDFFKVKFPSSNVFIKGTADFEPTFEKTFESFLKLIGDDYERMDIHVFTNEKPLHSLAISTSLELSAMRAYAVVQRIKTMKKDHTAVLVPFGFGNMYSATAKKNDPKYERIELKIYHLWGKRTKEDADETNTEGNA